MSLFLGGDAVEARLLNVVGGWGGEDDLAGAGGDDGLDVDVDGLADKGLAVGDDDHCTVGEVADSLAGIFTFLDQCDSDRLADRSLGVKGFGEGIEIEPLDIVESGDLGEVEVGGEQFSFERLGEKNQFGIHGLAVADGGVIDAQVDVRHTAQLSEDIEAFAPAFLLLWVIGVGDMLKFIDNKLWNNEGEAHKAGLADTEDTAIDEGGGVDEREGNIDIVGDKAHVRDDEVKLIAPAQGDDSAEVHQNHVQGEAHQVEILAQDDGQVVVAERQVKKRRMVEHVGAEPADKKAERQG